MACLQNIDLRLQRAAVALAEELNYKKAAEKLTLSHSALTGQIRELETELSVLLFERDKRHVALLPAGEVFVEESRLALMHSGRAIHRARAVASEKASFIVIGRCPYVEPDLIDWLFALELAIAPNLEIRVESLWATDLLKSVINGALDLVIAFELPETAGVTQVPLRTDPLYVALPAAHTCSDKKSLTLRDLSQADWAISPRAQHPWLYDRIMQKCEEQGVVLKSIQHALIENEWMELVRHRGFIALSTKSYAQRLQRKDVVFLPLAHNDLPLNTAMLMRSDNTSLVTSAFVRDYLVQLRMNPTPLVARQQRMTTAPRFSKQHQPKAQ